MATKPGSDDDRPVLDDDIRQIISDARPWEKKEPDDDRDVLREYEEPERVFVDVNAPQRIEAGGPEHNGEYAVDPPPVYDEPEWNDPDEPDARHTEGDAATGDSAVAGDDDDPDATVGDGDGAVDDGADGDAATGDSNAAPGDDDADPSAGDGRGPVDDSTKSGGADDEASSFGSGSTPDAGGAAASGTSSGDFGSGAGTAAAAEPTPEEAVITLVEVKEPEAAHDDGAFDEIDEIDEPKPADDAGDFQLDEKELDLDEIDDIELID